MNDACDNIQKEIMQGIGHQQHMAGCADCSAFADVYQLALTPVELENPPVESDQVILDLSRRRSSAQPMPILRWISVAAAVIVLLLTVTFFHFGPGSQKSITGQLENHELDGCQLAWDDTALDESLTALEIQIAAAFLDELANRKE